MILTTTNIKNELLNAIKKGVERPLTEESSSIPLNTKYKNISNEVNFNENINVEQQLLMKTMAKTLVTQNNLLIPSILKLTKIG